MIILVEGAAGLRSYPQEEEKQRKLFNERVYSASGQKRISPGRIRIVDIRMLILWISIPGSFKPPFALHCFYHSVLALITPKRHLIVIEGFQLPDQVV